MSRLETVLVDGRVGPAVLLRGVVYGLVLVLPFWLLVVVVAVAVH